MTARILNNLFSLLSTLCISQLTACDTVLIDDPTDTGAEFADDPSPEDREDETAAPPQYNHRRSPMYLDKSVRAVQASTTVRAGDFTRDARYIEASAFEYIGNDCTAEAQEECEDQSQDIYGPDADYFGHKECTYDWDECNCACSYYVDLHVIDFQVGNAEYRGDDTMQLAQWAFMDGKVRIE